MGINDVLADDLTSHTIDLMRYDANTRAKVRGELKKLEREIVRQIEKLPDSQVWKQARLEKMLASVQKSIRASYVRNKEFLTDDLTDLADLESDNAIGTLNKALKVEVATTTLPPNVVAEVAKNTLIEGAPSAEWWSRQAGSVRDRFADEMRQGIMLGETNADLVRRVRGTATGRRVTVIVNGRRRSVNEFAGGMMDVTTSQAEALVRTSVQTVANEARLQTYQQNDDVIKHVQALVTLDLRTTKICMARSGKVWTLDGKPVRPNTDPFPGAPPWHWNCRSTLVPITKSWGELSPKAKRLNEFPPTTQSAMDGQVAEELTYEGWLKTQSEAKQIQALGRRRWELWKEGKITSFSELIDQTGRPLTIAELEKKSTVTRTGRGRPTPRPRRRKKSVKNDPAKPAQTLSAFQIASREGRLDEFYQSRGDANLKEVKGYKPDSAKDAGRKYNEFRKEVVKAKAQLRKIGDDQQKWTDDLGIIEDDYLPKGLLTYEGEVVPDWQKQLRHNLRSWRRKDYLKAMEKAPPEVQQRYGYLLQKMDDSTARVTELTKIESAAVTAKEKLVDEYISVAQDTLTELYRTGWSSDVARAHIASEVNFVRVPRKIRKQVEEELEDFFRLTAGRGQKTIRTIEKVRWKGVNPNRAFADEINKLIHPGNGRPGVMLHEGGHHFEFEDVNIKNAAGQFIRRRGDKGIKPLRDLVPGSNYKPHEVAFSDDFLDPYVGKKYDDGDTEVVAMGMEQFQDEVTLAEFILRDIDHFRFMMGILR